MKNSDLEVLEHVANWLADGQEVNLVTLVSCWGSAPRPVGSMAAIRGDGAIIGSVSGGCIEKELTETLGKKSATGLIRHSISSDQAVRYGLSCGGSLELLFETAIDKGQVDELTMAAGDPVVLGELQDKKDMLDGLTADAKSEALRFAALPAVFMAVCYFWLIVWFKSRGGYKPVEI